MLVSNPVDVRIAQLEQKLLNLLLALAYQFKLDAGGKLMLKGFTFEGEFLQIEHDVESQHIRKFVISTGTSQAGLVPLPTVIRYNQYSLDVMQPVERKDISDTVEYVMRVRLVPLLLIAISLMKEQHQLEPVTR
jgi:hypothetical protein